MITVALSAAGVVAPVLALVSVQTAAAYSGPYTPTLTAGQWLYPGEYLMSNKQGANAWGFELAMQRDGNLVLYAPNSDLAIPGRPMWSTSQYTYGKSVQGLQMQGDGNLVMYDASGHAIWWPYYPGNASNPNSCSPVCGTFGHSGDYLTLQDDGNLVLYCGQSTASPCTKPSDVLWNTYTWNGNNTSSLAAPQNVTCPQFCRNTWAGPNTPIYFRAIDQFSQHQPSWRNPIAGAVGAWNYAPGPQYYSFTPRSNDTWVFISDVNPFTCGNNCHGIGQYSPLGITVNCYTSGFCADQVYLSDHSYPAGKVQWTDIYLNSNELNQQPSTPGWSIAQMIQHTAAHESGHAMLLAHNPLNPNSIMWPSFGTSTVGTLGPDTTNDIGASPGCADGGFGIRCIYHD